jgi:ABC-2 type transport system ATP-binding protein
MALLSVEDVSYKYGSYLALNAVSFEIEAGQLVVAVGRNGAGKSTLLRCVAGWTQITEGDVFILDKSVFRNERFIRRHVVLVPDTPPFYDGLTAWEHMQFIAQVNQINNWEERAEDYLDRYGLLPNKDAFPFAYSRGMRYKLALCMGLLISPEILLLDEPLGPLDPVSADNLWMELNRHRDEGMTIILSSHQLPHAAYPDRYLVMEMGELIADGAPEVLRETLALEGVISLDDLVRAAIQEANRA